MYASVYVYEWGCDCERMRVLIGVWVCVRVSLSEIDCVGGWVSENSIVWLCDCKEISVWLYGIKIMYELEFEIVRGYDWILCYRG